MMEIRSLFLLTSSWYYKAFIVIMLTSCVFWFPFRYNQNIETVLVDEEKTNMIICWVRKHDFVVIVVAGVSNSLTPVLFSPKSNTSSVFP